MLPGNLAKEAHIMEDPLILTASWDRPVPLRHTWEGLLNIDQFRWMVRRDTQDQLALAHAELGGRHVRAVGMYDDEMRVLGGDPRNYGKDEGVSRLNFQIVDYVMDSLLDRDIRPVFTTCFMPGTLAAGEKTVFTTRSRISPPNDLKAWIHLVTESVRHAIQRYGLSEVSQWYFEVWNEPNLQNGFFEGTQADFFELWKATFQAIKAVNTGLRVGGPSSARAEWIEDLVQFGRKHDCEPDYIITHIYNNDNASNPLSPFDGPQADKVNKSPNFAAGVVRGTRQLLSSLDYMGEIHWNEWGRSWRPCDHIRESAAEAAFIVKTMSEVSQEADYFAYWALSDIYDQVGYGREAFHGNYGALNLQGLRKPSYYAHQLLMKLGAQRFPVVSEGGDPCYGALASETEEYRQLLVFGFTEDYARETQAKVRVNLPPGLDLKAARAWRVDGSHGNTVAQWRALGAPDYLSREQTAALQAQNILEPAPLAALSAGEGWVEFTGNFPGILLAEFPKVG